MFLDKAELFLRLLNARWKMGGEEAKLVARLLEEHGLLPGARILDLGCGNGRIAVHLARYGYKVTGVDVSPLPIEDAQRKVEEH
ncbi:MAG TPA: methyltransferase domain-containing protein, partial [Candidatus Methanomethylia archaeon]|nr:methyltransferase domain-containing protein [Candidatus Methanomethylicia archaeon]